MDRTAAPARMERGTLARGPVTWITAPAALATLFTLLALAGCGASDGSARRELTQRQRDSTLGRSVIPGAGIVSRALRESDRAGGAAQALDAQVDSLAR